MLYRILSAQERQKITNHLLDLYPAYTPTHVSFSKGGRSVTEDVFLHLRTNANGRLFLQKLNLGSAQEILIGIENPNLLQGAPA